MEAYSPPTLPPFSTFSLGSPSASTAAGSFWLPPPSTAFYHLLPPSTLFHRLMQPWPVTSRTFHLNNGLVLYLSKPELLTWKLRLGTPHTRHSQLWVRIKKDTEVRLEPVRLENRYAMQVEVNQERILKGPQPSQHPNPQQSGQNGSTDNNTPTHPAIKAPETQRSNMPKYGHDV